MPVRKVDPYDVQHPFPQDLRQKRDTITNRNSINQNIRYGGLINYTEQEQNLSYLKGGIDNSNWKRILDEDDLGAIGITEPTFTDDSFDI